MSTGALLELLLGIATFVAGVWLYRKRIRKDPDGPRRYGSQSGTFVIVISLILIVDALTRAGAGR
jgi:hypothetical protein